MTNDTNQYRNAIVLNNIGVSLLERRCFQAALDTLKEATALIKATFYIAGSDDCDSATIFEQKLHLARLRLSDTYREKSVKKNHRRSQFQAEVFTNNNVCTKSIRQFSEDAPHCSKVYAIRIEDFDLRSTNIESLTAILLFNLGFAYYSVSKAGRSNKSGKKKRFHKHSNRALRLFRISHSLFSKKVSKHKETNGVPELLHVMALLVLNTLIIQTLYDCQRHAEALPFRSMLQHLRCWTWNEAAFGVTNGAAAAA